jgi:hypothetical protein
MSIASTTAKQRWNKTHYSEIKASLKKELVEQFKIKCKENEVSIASVLAMLMSEYCGKRLQAKKNKKTPKYDTRPKRRKMIDIITNQLEEILECESSYRSRMPENLENSIRAEAADLSIEKISEALDAIREAY